MYDNEGNKTWEADLDIYGKVRNFAGRSLNECPFRWQGQYFDEETGLCCQKFRYYDPDTGNYISQDPIGMFGGFTLYSYVKDTNSWIDPLGLSAFSDCLAKGAANNTVYVNAPNGINNPINYGGITNNPIRRAGEHAGRFDNIITLKGSGNLTRNQARAIEEAIVKNQELSANGGLLENKIHSISPKREIYDDAVQLGEQWLKENGHDNLLNKEKLKCG